MQRINERRVLDRENPDSIVGAPAQGREHLLPFGVVSRDIAHQHQRAINLLAGDLEGFDHALRILPPVEPRYLHNEGEIGGNVMVRESIIDF